MLFLKKLGWSTVLTISGVILSAIGGALGGIEASKEAKETAIKENNKKIKWEKVEEA